MIILTWFLSPIGRAVGALMGILLLGYCIYALGYTDGSVAERTAILERQSRVVEKANKARTSSDVRNLTDRVYDNDGFRRD